MALRHTSRSHLAPITPRDTPQESSFLLELALGARRAVEKDLAFVVLVGLDPDSVPSRPVVIDAGSALLAGRQASLRAAVERSKVLAAGPGGQTTREPSANAERRLRSRHAKRWPL
jgi:hypothetical protein